MDIFSTYVEMNRWKTNAVAVLMHFLYVCGDEPVAGNAFSDSV